ncbi:MAG: TrkH family potassium uptake protein [Thermodesulfobacteriota bacterium]
MIPVFVVLGLLNLFLAACMTVPLGISLLIGEGTSEAFALAIAVTALVGAAFYLPLRNKGREISRRHAFAIVFFGWVSAGVFGAIPLALSGIFAPIDALFEVVSGFTTTGASVVSGISELPRAILFWRALTQWLGGMGIILLSIAILPLLGVGGVQLYRAEVPGPFHEKLAPSIAETAKILWKTYILITGVQAILLLLGGMDVLDAVCHSFATMATGGFSTKTESIAHYGHYHRVVIIFFMMVAGINFALHHRFLRGEYGAHWADREFRFYLGLLGLGSASMFLVLMMGMGGNWLQRMEDSVFQGVSIMTTTGFTTADFDKWPTFCRYLLLLLMFVGGCAGSTGGGIKCVRVILIYKYMQGELKKLLHPHAVVVVKLGQQAVPPALLHSVLGMSFLYLGIFVLASICMTLQGLDLITSVSSVAATLGNIGPGLAAVGPTAHYGDISVAGKIILIFCMLAGRLEIYTVMIMLFPGFWRR